MKKLYLLNFLLIGFVLISISGCDPNTPTSDEVQAAKQEQLNKESNAQAGMPNVHNFQMKKLMKTIIEMCDQENLICYAYIVPEYTGKPVFLGKCLGYGLPYATQYTNPQRVEHPYTGVWYTIPQADPDGLFKPASADGTWLMMIDPKTNEPHVVYIEPKILVSPFPLN